jgi:hypothetical protein
MHTNKLFEVISIFGKFQTMTWISFSMTNLDHDKTSYLHSIIDLLLLPAGPVIASLTGPDEK